jgi:hypothetical protein
MEKKIDKKMDGHIKTFLDTRKAVLETSNMIKNNLLSRNKYKNMVVNLDLLKDNYLCEAWGSLQAVERMTL